jgi:hypothetical protein
MSLLAERMSANPDIPFEIRKTFANAEEPSGPNCEIIIMWREVVARAIMDALGYTGQTEPDKHNAILREAQWWFKYSPDLQEVFDFAGIPLKTTRDSVMENFALTKVASKNTPAKRKPNKGKR